MVTRILYKDERKEPSKIYMKIKLSKEINPSKFQQVQLSDLDAHQKKMSSTAKKFSPKAEVVVDKCYLCGAKENRHLLDVYGFSYVECLNCTHVYSTKRLSKRSLNKFYLESETYSKTYIDKDQIEYRIKNIAQPKVSYVLSKVKNKSAGSWLDIGCGAGDLIKCVQDIKGWKAVGVEISKHSTDFGINNLGVDINQQTFSSYSETNHKTKFDVVSFFGYLGLVSDPAQQLRLAKKHLKKGGILVVGDSNADSISTLLVKSYPQLTLRHFVPPTTLHQFSPTSLKKILTKLGFQPTDIWIFGLDFYEFLKYTSQLNSNFQNSPVFDFFLDNINDFQKVIDKKMKGDYMIMIAKNSSTYK